MSTLFPVIIIINRETLLTHGNTLASMTVNGLFMRQSHRVLTMQMFFGLPTKTTNALRRVQNRAARLIMRLERRYRLALVLRKLATYLVTR